MAKASDDLAVFAAARRQRMRPANKCKVCALPPALVEQVERGRVEYSLPYTALAEYVQQHGHPQIDHNKIAYHLTGCRRVRGAA